MGLLNSCCMVYVFGVEEEIYSVVWSNGLIKWKLYLIMSWMKWVMVISVFDFYVIVFFFFFKIVSIFKARNMINLPFTDIYLKLH